MPELPEVETVRRGLAPSMEGAVLKELELRRNDLRFPFPADFAQAVSGRGITSLSRRAKYLLIDLDDGKTIVAHLGMSGSFRVEEGAVAETPGTFHHPRSKDSRSTITSSSIWRVQAAMRASSIMTRAASVSWISSSGPRWPTIPSSVISGRNPQAMN